MRLLLFQVVVFSLFLAKINQVAGQDRSATVVGRLPLDSTWKPTVYLSHIPTFEEMHHMSSNMIIAESPIDSDGHFALDLDFLPMADHLYRLHVVKKGNTPATLILGGKDENHLFFVLDGATQVELEGLSAYAPFKEVRFNKSVQNNAIQHISNLVYKVDSTASESSASKRALLEKQLHADLLHMADTSNDLMVSLYAIYKSNFESNYANHLPYYTAFRDKWEDENNPYFLAFAHHLPERNSSNYSMIVLLALLLGVGGFALGKRGLGKDRKLKKLTVQERKVYALLLQSASNQEIADQLNIGLSTTKSHVSSIFSKLKVKSRKEIVNRK